MTLAAMNTSGLVSTRAGGWKSRLRGQAAGFSGFRGGWASLPCGLPLPPEPCVSPMTLAGGTPRWSADPSQELCSAFPGGACVSPVPPQPGDVVGVWGLKGCDLWDCPGVPRPQTPSEGWLASPALGHRALLCRGAVPGSLLGRGSSAAGSLRPVPLAPANLGASFLCALGVQMGFLRAGLVCGEHRFVLRTLFQVGCAVSRGS